MLKKLNVCIVFLVLILSLKLNVGYSIYLPVLIFYLFKDIKNIYYTFIPTVFTVTLFLNEYFISTLLILILTLFFYIFQTSFLSNKFKIRIPNIIFISALNLLYFIYSRD